LADRGKAKKPSSITYCPTFALSGSRLWAVRLNAGLGRTTNDAATALMAERTALPRTHNAARRLATDERSATQRTDDNGGGAMRTNRALTAEGRAARADRDSEAVTKLDG
jgi:hypothetical protein